MNCVECQQLLQLHLEGGPISEQAALDAHLATCVECRSWHAAAHLLEQGLSGLAPPAPPAGLADRIVVGVLAERWSALRFRRRVLALAAVAASLLALVLLGRLWQHGGESGPAPSDESQLAKETPLAQKHDLDHSPPGPSLRKSLAEAREAAAELTLGKTSDTVRPAWSWWSELVQAPASDGKSPKPLDPTAKSLRDAGNGVSAGLEPVTDSARRAFNLFLREIPPMESEEKRGL
jgi:hypothetical protein